MITPRQLIDFIEKAAETDPGIMDRPIEIDNEDLTIADMKFASESLECDSPYWGDPLTLIFDSRY